MSSVNITEVASKVYEMFDSEEQCKLAIEPFVSSIIEFDKTQCYIAASLKKQTKHKGLSLADRACLATALYLRLPVYTADRIWTELGLYLI